MLLLHNAMSYCSRMLLSWTPVVPLYVLSEPHSGKSVKIPQRRRGTRLANDSVLPAVLG